MHREKHELFIKIRKDEMGFFEILAQYYQYFLRGTRTTIVVALFTVLCGAVLGCLIALMRLSNFKPFQWFSKLYITVIRGTPMLVQLYIVCLLYTSLHSSPGKADKLHNKNEAQFPSLLPHPEQAADRWKAEWHPSARKRKGYCLLYTSRCV